MALKEIWLPIDGAPSYEVSNMGRVRHGDKLMHSFIFTSKNGIPYRVLSGGYTKGTRYLGRIVAQTFLEQPDNPKAQVKYINGDTLDCRADNLRWETEQDRHDRANKMRSSTTEFVRTHGYHPRSHHWKTIAPEVVAEAQEIIANGCLVHASDLAKKHGVASSTIYHILKSAGISYTTRKLTDEQIADIRAEYAEGGIRQIDLAVWYDVDISMISRILKGSRR